MSIRALLPRSSLRALRPEVGFSLGQFKADPLTSQYVAPFEALLAKLGVVNEQEQVLYDRAVESKALVNILDRKLNVLASRVSKAVLILTEESTSHDLYRHYFGRKTLKEFIRPTLAGQLHAMRGWIPSLQKSEHASLKALGAEIDVAVKEADEAAKKKIDVEQEIKDFRETGDRKKYFEELNVARRVTHGELARIAHENGLAASYPDSFFLHDVSENEEEETVETVKDRITALTAELDAQNKRLKELVAEEEVRAQAEAEENEERAKLAEFEKAEKEAAKKAAALRAKLKK